MADNSSVYHRDALDNEHRKEFARMVPSCPWIFDTDDEGQAFFPTEDEAYRVQLYYRRRHGFDPISGE